jgi:hypothetical protein
VLSNNEKCTQNCIPEVIKGRHTCKDNIKMDFKEKGNEDVGPRTVAPDRIPGWNL